MRNRGLQIVRRKTMKAAVIFILAVTSVHARSPLLASTTWLKSYTASASTSLGNEVINTCDDGACNIVRGPDNSALHQTVLDEWKSADGSNLHDKPSGINDSTDNLTGVPATTYNQTSDIATLTDMGWTSEEAQSALNQCNNDITKAADLLLAKEEETDLRIARLDELVAGGWQQQAAYAALETNDGNKTAAEAWLVKEEETVNRSFLVAVEDMVAHGWSEYVAREALLSQFIMNQRAANGENVTVAAEILQKIHPSLRKPVDTPIPTDSAKETKSADFKNPSSQSNEINAESTSNTKAAGPAKVEPALPAPARKEDVVFQVTAANFQSVVLESPVPVVLDVYADWCGPCKQLGPVLEEAAVKAGGAFRLVKVNSDQERSLAEVLGVQSLPTVFTVDKGQLTDRFVGMLPREQLQKYLVRAITGAGERVQSKEVSQQALEQTGEQVASLAGAASLTFKRKEQLYTQVEAALALPGAFVEGSNAVLTPGMKLALSHIHKARKNIRDETCRGIDTRAGLFQTHIATASPAAQKLLQVAGFVADSNSKSVTEADKLHLSHFNPAILTLVSQRVDELVRDKKFSKMRSTTSAVLPSRHTPSPVKLKPPPPVTPAVKSAPTQASAKPSVDSKSVPEKVVSKTDAKNTRGAKASATLRSADSVAAPLTNTRSASSASSGTTKKSTVPPKKASIKASKVNTVFSTGIVAPKKKKFNEYFGGDSTVVSAGEEEQEEKKEEENDVKDVKKGK